MTDLDVKQTVTKLENLKTVICELFVKDHASCSEIIEKLEQMEKLIADLPNVPELAVYWQQKLIVFWKSLGGEGLNPVILAQSHEDENVLPVASENPVDFALETVEVDRLATTCSQLTIHSSSTEDVNVKNEPFTTHKRHAVSKKTLNYISNYIKKNSQESIKDDDYQLSATTKEEDDIIRKTESDLANLPSIEGPSDIEAIKKLHLFTEKVRYSEPSAMFTQQSASIFLTAFEKMSLDLKESYSQLNYAKDATKSNYRCWSNLAIFLKTQMISYYTKDILASTDNSCAENRSCNYCKQSGHFFIQPHLWSPAHRLHSHQLPCELISLSINHLRANIQHCHHLLCPSHSWTVLLHNLFSPNVSKVL